MLGVAVSPAGAITGNYVKDTEHPFVGLATFYDANGDFSHRCSGSLLTPIVFLTAGHCADGATTARVYFQQDAGANYDPELGYDPKTGYPESCLSEPCATSDELYNYGFNEFEGFPDTRDLGLIILDEPIELAEYGELTAPGTLDRLATRRGLQNLTFTVSGYGLTESSPTKVVSFRERLMAKSKLVNTRSALTDGFNLQTSANRGGGRGGTCSGDSGGPVFYPADSNVIVGVTSFGLNAWCRGTDFAYRTDTKAVIDWILATVPE
ncbi:MAG: trypsin-like serine protease, partial [Chloroflexota bacterium]|nr:trypsin-like serine protease [Chloroflexota bacterium]